MNDDPSARTSNLLTPARLREHAGSPDNMVWSGQARQLLRWAADLIEAADAVMAERRSDETTSEWLTDKQCDDVIAFLEDYEWTGLTRENVRTWCTAIAEARSSVKASGES